MQLQFSNNKDKKFRNKNKQSLLSIMLFPFWNVMMNAYFLNFIWIIFSMMFQKHKPHCLCVLQFSFIVNLPLNYWIWRYMVCTCHVYGATFSMGYLMMSLKIIMKLLEKFLRAHFICTESLCLVLSHIFHSTPLVVWSYMLLYICVMV